MSRPTEDSIQFVDSDSDVDSNVDVDRDRDSTLNDTNERPTKRSRNESNTVDTQLLEHAKSRLSKWAARLFDPDRPRGLVQAPETIPLNDEYLKAFGERVKKEQSDLQIDATIGSDTEEDILDANTAAAATSSVKKKKKTTTDGTKIKIANLAFSTDVSILRAACERYGPLLDVNLILDKDNPSLNSGRAYVTFEHEDDALECLDRLKELGGRMLRLSLATEKPKPNPASTPGAHASRSLLNRFLDKDISTVCFRCGQVGHYESDCKNPAKPRPCTLCGGLDHQDRRCDHRIVCFNCGCVGHSVRDCTERRGMPRRLVCGICFESGHHRNSCQNYRGNSFAEQQAICMLCGKQGHFLCKELKWFYGLKGMFCFNCGGQGHSGLQCSRPNVFQCRDDPETANNEIQRAEAESVAELLQRQRQAQQNRGRPMERGYQASQRARSMPPQTQRNHAPNNHRPVNNNGRGYR